MPRKLLWMPFLLLVCCSSLRAAELLPPDRAIGEVIDHYVDLNIKQAKLQPAPQASDANVIRRTTLDLAGRIPTVAEAKAYVASKDPNKRAKLIERLLASPAHVRHQATEFDTLLMYGKGSLRDYLLKSMKENRPWDRMFREMMLGEKDDKEQKGAIGFVKARVKDTDKLVNDTSVIFFGVNVSCAKCHDHPLVLDWTQDHFFGMQSFFSATFDNGGLLAEREFGEVKFKTTSGEEKQAKLMFLTGTVIDTPEIKPPTDKEKKEEKKRLAEFKKKKQPMPPPSFSRRSQLVDVALGQKEDNFFARAIVNNLWFRFYGHGLVMPLDQMHSGNEASHPELLEWLARDLVAHKYDLRRLVQGLVSSRAYVRSSRWEGEKYPAEDLFAVAMVRPLTPQQYAMTLRMASSNPDKFAADMKPEDFQKRIEGIENAARGLAGQFEQPRDGFQVSVNEALSFSNGQKAKDDLLRDAGDSLLGKVKGIEDRRAAIETAVWSVFTRPAEEEEIKLLEGYLQQRQDRSLAAYRQMIWALLTSSESRFNY